MLVQIYRLLNLSPEGTGGKNKKQAVCSPESKRRVPDSSMRMSFIAPEKKPVSRRMMMKREKERGDLCAFYCHLYLPIILSWLQLPVPAFRFVFLSVAWQHVRCLLMGHRNHHS